MCDPCVFVRWMHVCACISAMDDVFMKRCSLFVLVIFFDGSDTLRHDPSDVRSVVDNTNPCPHVHLVHTAQDLTSATAKYSNGVP